jgi:hypothetical protein
MHKTVNAQFESRIITITSPGFSGRSLRGLLAGGTLRLEPPCYRLSQRGRVCRCPGTTNGLNGESVVEQLVR